MHKKSEAFTIVIIPRKETHVKRIHLTANFIIVALVVFTLSSLCATYFVYDYISIRRDKAELYALKSLTKEQKTEINALAERVSTFTEDMDKLKQLDKEIRVIANLDSDKNKKRMLGVGGPVSTQNKLRVLLEGDNKAVIDEMRRSVDGLTEEATEQKQSFVDLLDFLKRQKSMLAATPSVWPVRGWITCGFGNRKSPFGSRAEFHAGVDIAAGMGTPIKAPAEGIVIEAGYQPFMGNAVLIEHGYGMKTWYGHMSKVGVKTGKRVKRGDIIGYVGNSGRSTGAHLHYGVYINGVAVNPMRYMQ